MANALPQAIGAQITYPGRQVISMSGDGGIAMMMGDLLTLRQHDLPVKIIVFKNDSLGFVELEMKAAGLLEFGTGLDNPNFADMARAMGIHGARVEDPGELDSALKAALQHPGPAVIDVVVNRQELATPPTITGASCVGAASVCCHISRASDMCHATSPAGATGMMRRSPDLVIGPVGEPGSVMRRVIVPVAAVISISPSGPRA